MGIFLGLLFLCLSLGAAIAEVALLQRFFPRLFAARDPDRCGVVSWWELRRIPYNVLVGVYGIVCLLVFYGGIEASGELQPGEDAVEPMAVLAAPLLANACYTLGWVAELLVGLLIGPSPQIGLFLFRVGVGFSLLVITFPATVWGVLGVLRWACATL